MSALWFILKHKIQYQTLIRVMNYFILVIILLRYLKVLMKSTTSLIILIKKNIKLYAADEETIVMKTTFENRINFFKNQFKLNNLQVTV